MKAPVFAIIFCLLICPALMAQTSTLPDAPQSQPRKHRRFFSPALDAANDTRPMNAGDKFKLFAINVANPFQIVASAGWAGIDQAEDRFPAWGQGGEGYGKRFGANYADNASGYFFSTFLFPSLLHQDPRYFRKETGPFGSRLGYALSRMFVTRTDHGNSAPNASLWMGSLASGGLSNLYYTSDEQGVGLTFERAGINIATNAGFNIAREFWPDVSRRLFHRKK